MIVIITVIDFASATTHCFYIRFHDIATNSFLFVCCRERGGVWFDQSIPIPMDQVVILNNLCCVLYIPHVIIINFAFDCFFGYHLINLFVLVWESGKNWWRNLRSGLQSSWSCHQWDHCFEEDPFGAGRRGRTQHCYPRNFSLERDAAW